MTPRRSATVGAGADTTMAGYSAGGQARPRVIAGLRLVRLVGRGGEGEVWEVRNERGRRRALKLIRPEALADPREVGTRGGWLERIDHPALVRVHASGVLDEGGPHGGSLDGWGWAEMDFVEGRDLSAAGPQPDVLERLTPLAEALDLLHAGYWSDGVPLVHRDVKPANIVDTGDSGLVLVDPSTLRGLDAEDLEMTRVGTPLFVAPEVVTGRLGPAADVYSFAATAVALVTGARGRDLAALLAVPDQLDLPWGVRAALSPDPAVRPRTCAAVLADTDLSSWLPAERNRHDPRGVHEAVGDEPAPGSRWPWAAALLVLLAGAWTLVLSGRPGPPVLAGLLPGPATGRAAGAVLLAALHLAACRLAGASMLLSVAAPPVAWALVLADRSPGPRRRRALQRALLTGGYVTATVGAVMAPAVAPLWPAVAALTTVAVPVVVESSGAAALAGRVALTPLWAVGAAVWLAGAALLLLPAFALARTRRLVRAAGLVVASLVEVPRSPA